MTQILLERTPHDVILPQRAPHDVILPQRAPHDADFTRTHTP